MIKRATRLFRNQFMGPITAFLFLFLSTGTASAHDGQPPAPHDLWSAWNWDPFIVSSLLLSGWIYASGIWELQQRTGGRRSALTWRPVSFAAGLFTLFLALISTLDALATALFSAHMIQHTLLIVIAPPLLVLGVFPAPFLRAFPQPVQRKIGQWWHKIEWLKPAWHILTQLPVAWVLSILVLWVWHAPRLYQSALQNETLHTLEHLGFVGTSLLFWKAIARPGTRFGRGDLGILALFTMALQGGLLGALLTFAPMPLYEVYASTTQAWGLTPLEDQQLAGAIMWVPMGTVYTLAALILLMIRLAWIERTANQRELMSVTESARTEERPEY